MSSQGSVTGWFSELEAGNHAAAQQLWERYFRRLIGLARKKLEGMPRRMADEDDVASSAFASFCRAAEQGRFPQLADRHDLWRLLATITARKVYQLRAYLDREMRDVDKEVREAERAIEQILAQAPSPEFAAQFAEEYQQRLASLGDAGLQAVAVWKMEGYTTEEIAAKLGCVPRSVERKLRRIRDLWSQESPA